MENDTVDLIKSAYPLDDIEKRIIDYDKKGSLIVIDKKRAEILLATIGITPSQLSSFLNSDDTIPQSSPKINTQSNIQGKKSKNDAFYFDDVESLKERQNSIVQQNNSMHDDYHTGIRGVEDIYTFEEALGNGEYEEGEDFTPDYTWRMAQRSVSSGKITVYSSYPIKQGVFVTPSKTEAEGYTEKI